MKRKAPRKDKKDKPKKKNVDWNRFLKITKIIELNNIITNNNDSKSSANKKEKKSKTDIDDNRNNLNKNNMDKGENTQNIYNFDKERNINVNKKANENTVFQSSFKEKSNYDNIKISNGKNINNDEKINNTGIIASNINSEFKNVAADPNGIIEKNEADIVEVKGDGNCLYRCFSYFLFGTQNFYLNIKKLIIEWIEYNYEKFTSFFGDDDINNITKEQLAKEEFDYTKKENSWGGDLHINIFCILFNCDVAVFNERNGKYQKYFFFHIPEVNTEELIILLYGSHHYNLIYPKRNNMKIKQIYKDPTEVNKNDILKADTDKITFNKPDNKYILVNYPNSSNIYNEIYQYYLSIQLYKNEIEIKRQKYPNMNFNQILSYFKIIYPERIKGKTQSDSNKRAKFRLLCENFQLNDEKRLLIKNPYKSDINNNDNKWYYIPLTNEKESLLEEYHWKYNHCGRDAMIDLLKSNNWYWYGFYQDVTNFVKQCPFCDNSKSKFKQIKTGIKVIIDKGPHFRYIADLWYLAKDISKISGYKYILDIIDHFSKWYQGYPLKTKTSDEVLAYIDSFNQSFGKPVILQTDNGLEFCNSELNNYCTNNDIKIVHGKPRHPQSQGACEVCHKEIKKYIYTKFLEDEANFNLNKSLVEITNIHNNKKHSITEEIPKNIRDIDNKDDINIINERIEKNIGRKNKNIDIINFNRYYCINSDLIVKGNKLEKIKKKSKKKIFKIPVLILSETDHFNEFLIEIQNSYSCFEKGDTYLIQADLLFETDETLWNKLL